MKSENKSPVEATQRYISLQTKLIIGFSGLSALVSFLTARGIYTNMQNLLTDDVRARFVTQSTYVFFFAVGLGIAFGLVAGKVITDSILKLSTGAKAFATGDLSGRIELDTHDEITDLAETFNIMASEIQGLISNLEQRVTERTTDLESRTKELETANEDIQRRSAQFEALAQVSQSISSVRDLQELLPHVTSVVSEKYGFYHVGVFLLDEASEYAVLIAANSEGGKKMLERNHRLKVGAQGIVGSVTASGESRIALDVGKDAVFFNNPDLPDTHSEMALPILSAGKIIGALDVQSTETGAFSNEDLQTLSLLANQVSLAIESARLFDESKTTLDELQIISRQTTREAWKRLPEQQKLLGYRYNAMGATPLKELVNLAETGKGKTKVKGTEAGSFVVPIELRGESIGNLVVQSPSGREWNADEQDIIRAVADRVALSAENARLFEETTNRAERERLVSEITGKIRSHNDPQTMIETAVNELRNALGASRVEIVPQTTGTERKD
jgi:GAF domain-containing protein/HAMP domain-containing protein